MTMNRMGKSGFDDKKLNDGWKYTAWPGALRIGAKAGLASGLFGAPIFPAHTRLAAPGRRIPEQKEL